RRLIRRRKTTLPSASKPWTWKIDFAMSTPIVMTVCMASSSESWEPQQLPLASHSRAGQRSRPQHHLQTAQRVRLKSAQPPENEDDRQRGGRRRFYTMMISKAVIRLAKLGVRPAPNLREGLTSRLH